MPKTILKIIILIVIQLKQVYFINLILYMQKKLKSYSVI